MNLFEKVLCGKNIEVLGYVFCTISIIGFSEQRTELEGLCCTQSVVSNSLQPQGLQPTASSVHGDSSGKNTGVSGHVLLKGIFPTQGLNPGLLHCRWILYQLSYQGRPKRLQSHSILSYSSSLKMNCQRHFEEENTLKGIYIESKRF